MPKPELLAPAGSIDAFHAAIDAGADAVYLGLERYNARIRARNFTVKTLSYLVPYAHAKKVRVYVTLNTLVKQSEIADACTLLYQLDQLGVDALITADFGLIAIARKHFPRLVLHASTQMLTHNAVGAEALGRLGITRVILARELTLDEIAAIRAESDIELEVFAHGALCYSLSGACLASSMLHGASGNRGRCMQVCRRVFDDGTSRGCFFSPLDFMAIESLPRYRQIGISALKIEGRLRSVEYVHTVVTIYRAALDNPAAIPRLIGGLDCDMGRRKTRLFLDGLRREGVIDARPFAGTGVELGTIVEIRGNTAVLRSGQAVAAGDEIRVHPASGFEGRRVKVTGVSAHDGELRVTLAAVDGITPGDHAYLVATRAVRAAIPRHDGRLAVRPAMIQTVCPFTTRILRSLPPADQTGGDEQRLYLRIDSPGQLDATSGLTAAGLILSFTLADFHSPELPFAARKPGTPPLLAELPPFIAGSDLASWRSVIDRLMKAGVRSWICNNPGQRLLFDRRARLVAGRYLWSLNRFSRQALADAGFERFFYSPEDDFPNIRACACARGMMTVFGRLPLFVSRIAPGCRPGAITGVADDARYRVEVRDRLSYLVTETPFCIFHRIDKLTAAGIREFVIDLGWYRSGEISAGDLMRAFAERSKVTPSSMYNFKLGLQ